LELSKRARQALPDVPRSCGAERTGSALQMSSRHRVGWRAELSPQRLHLRIQQGSHQTLYDMQRSHRFIVAAATIAVGGVVILTAPTAFADSTSGTTPSSGPASPHTTSPVNDIKIGNRSQFVQHG
jgi:hypothetical protein